MSWIRDIEGDLINLDKVHLIQVCTLEEPTEDETHALVAQTEEYSYHLSFGDEAHCIRARDLIASKLAMVRV